MKKNKILILVCILLSITTFAQKPENYDKELKTMYNNTVKLIYPDQLVKEIENDSPIILLDAREKAEHKTSHIKNSKCIGYSQFDIKSIENIPKDANIVIYCSLGVRSEQIGEKLLALGYTNVRNLYGGIFEWVYLDYPIYDRKEVQTKSVHTYDQKWSTWLLKGEKIY